MGCCLSGQVTKMEEERVSTGIRPSDMGLAHQRPRQKEMNVLSSGQKKLDYHVQRVQRPLLCLIINKAITGGHGCA